jgi:hypothetical protein
LVHSFILPFVHSFIRSFIHSFVHSFTRDWFIHSFIHSFIRDWFIHSFVPSFIHSFIHSLIHPSVHALIHSSIYSFSHSIRSFISLHSSIHSSDPTRLPLIDIFASVSSPDVHSGALSPHTRRETWWVRRAEGPPDLLASVGRRRIHVARQLIPEESTPSLAGGCASGSLAITAVDFVALSRDPLRPSIPDMHKYGSESLRDLRPLLSREGVSVDELLARAREGSHPRLRQMLAEWGLAATNLAAAGAVSSRGKARPGSPEGGDPEPSLLPMPGAACPLVSAAVRRGGAATGRRNRRSRVRSRARLEPRGGTDRPRR